MKHGWCGLAVWSVLCGAALGGEVVVEELAVARHAASGLTVVGGDVVLPGRGIWELVESVGSDGVLSGVTLEAPELVYEAASGRRGKALQQERRERAHAAALRRPYWQLAQWARAHEGQLPDEKQWRRDDKSNRSLKQSLERAMASLPVRPEALLEVPAKPYVVLVEAAMFEFEKPRYAGHEYVRGTNAAPILVELYPQQDDGKHYVLRANGRLERVAIDAALMTRLGVEVKPLALDPAAGQFPQEARYRLVAQQHKVAPCRLSISNRMTGVTLAVSVPVGEAPMEGGKPLLREWCEWREGMWEYLAEQYDAPGLRTWGWLQKAMLAEKASTRPRRRNRRRGATTDMMGVLGGRAALRETLQLDALRVGGDGDGAMVPIETISGVEVKSHPFEEMLAGVEPGSYPLARYVPQDRFFVGVPKPEALLPLLDEGAGFLSRVGAGATGRALSYDLKQRYLDALGVNEFMVRTLVENRAIREVAFFAPDLFFADGTDVTAVVRLQGAAGVKMLFTLMGMKGGGGDAVRAVSTPTGGKAWWGLVDDVVVMGNSRREVAAVMALAGQDGVGSLGQSAEFRYMLTRVPATPQTRAYVYFSDPFIRRLVGPEVKIGQVRRLKTKAHLQTVVYASLLREHDGFGAAGTVPELVEAGYLPAAVAATGITLDAAGVPVSADYGPLPRMASIYAADLSMVSTNESLAYASYKENYTRYWRRFFDPIAMRVDEDGDELVATTYILPLLDNSLYEGVRQVVNADAKVPLRVPQLDPQPTAMLSLNLSEKAWHEMLRDGIFEMAMQMGIEGSALDQLGPALHFAVFDAEPVIAFGSRSLLGMGGHFGDFDDEMMIPLLISLLTRPCALLVELQDPEPIREFLASGALMNVFEDLGGEVELTSYRVAGRDSRVAGVDYWGLSLRFSFSVEGQYLVIGNMPWREPVHVVADAPVEVAGASVQVVPAAAKIEARALHLSAMEGQRQAVMEGLAYLYPLLAAGVPPEQAVVRHRELLGFAPVLPEGVTLAWDGDAPGCTGFGDLFTQAQPPFDADAVFGALQGVGAASASMQFEDTGLRTIVRWHMTPANSREGK